MNGITKALLGVGLSYLTLKLLTTRPVKIMLLGALLDGAYIVMKKKLKD
ncbi:MAG: hypothetical protein ACLFUB_02190 [Cyclobacteriaceae bacterium]